MVLGLIEELCAVAPPAEERPPIVVFSGCAWTSGCGAPAQTRRPHKASTMTANTTLRTVKLTSIRAAFYRSSLRVSISPPLVSSRDPQPCIW